MKNLYVVFAAAMLLLFSCRKQASDQLAPQVNEKIEQQGKMFEKPKDIPKYEQGVLLVKYKTEQTVNKKGLNVLERVRTKAMEKYNDNGYYKVRVDNVEKTMASLKSDPDVEWVSPNWTETVLDFQPNDPYYTGGSMYGLSNIHADVAWNSGNVGKQDVYVVVIDEGQMYWHCDLFGNNWVNQEEMNGVPGVDDDHNGYIDDFRGWNWFNGSNELYTGNDDHGTHVAGTIAGKGNNGIGVIGVAPNVKIISLKFLADYGYDNDAIKAIDYAIDLKSRKGLNIKVMSNSWGGGGFNQGLIDAINRAKAADILFVCAAGNSNNNNDINASPSYPSSYPNDNIIAVGASDWTNTKATFSSYGKTTVDLFAPGVNIWSTLPSATHTPSYGSYSGTSMATPHVSGAIALLTSINPELSWSQIKQTIMSTVTPVASLAPYCVTGGVLNVSTFTGITNPVVPNADCGTPPLLDTKKPSTMTLILDSIVENPVTDYATFFLRWEKPTDENPIVDLIFSLTPYDTWVLQGNEWTGYAFSLPMDRLYTIKAWAVDSWGNAGLPSNTITKDYSGTPPPTDNIPPSIPQNLRASNITNGAFTASWDASTDNVGVKDYKIHWRPKGNSTWTMTFTTGTSYRPTLLLPNTTYEFAVIARDLADNYSDTSSVLEVFTSDAPPPPDTQPPTLNGSPTVSNITASSITFNHSAASDNVGVQSYEVNWRAAGGIWLQRVSSNLSETFSNLSQGTTYEFFYTAKDAAGNVSSPSNTIQATTLNPPPPSDCNITSNLNGAAQSLNVTLNWTTTVTGNCTLSSSRLERSKGGSGVFTVVAFNPNSPYTDVVPNPGNYIYRLQLQSSSGNTFYSNEKTIKVNKK